MNPIFEVMDHLKDAPDELDTVNGYYHDGLQLYKSRQLDWCQISV